MTFLPASLQGLFGIAYRLIRELVGQLQHQWHGLGHKCAFVTICYHVFNYLISHQLLPDISPK
jgi:hypothetical protein